MSGSDYLLSHSYISEKWIPGNTDVNARFMLYLFPLSTQVSFLQSRPDGAQNLTLWRRNYFFKF